MIYRDISKRGSGKSTRLLKKALVEGYNIATSDMVSARTFKRIAINLGVDPVNIREENNGHIFVRDVHIAPISYWLDAGNCGNRNKILVDELTLCLNRVLNWNFAGYSDTFEQED